MKTMTALSGVLLAIATAACSAAASAQPPQTGATGATEGALSVGRHGHSHHEHRDPSALVARLDANKDGKLQLTELPERMRERLATADTDKDGVLSVAELTSHHARAKQERFARADKNGDGALQASEVGDRKWDRIEVADANKDGKVTFAEVDAARAAGVLRGARGDRDGRRGKPSAEAVIARFDANKDGVLQTSEIPERMRPWIERADANKDGAISKDELNAAREAHDREAPGDRKPDGDRDR
jgi:EF hand